MAIRKRFTAHCCFVLQRHCRKNGYRDPTTAGAAGNAGLRARYVFSKTSGTVEMTGPIFSDIFMYERLLLSYVDLKVILNRSSDEFCLMASEDDADYKVKLTDAYLKIRKVKVNPSISVAHEIALKKGPAIYPIRRVECKSFIVPAWNPSLRKDNLFNAENICAENIYFRIGRKRSV